MQTYIISIEGVLSSVLNVEPLCASRMYVNVSGVVQVRGWHDRQLSRFLAA